VVDGTRLVGVLTHADLLKAMARHHPNILVQEVMETQVETSIPSEGLHLALTRMQQSESQISMVIDDQRVIGLLTVESISELLRLKRAAGRDVLRVPIARFDLPRSNARGA
jgi:predicted transcriptional regulator